MLRSEVNLGIHHREKSGETEVKVNRELLVFPFMCNNDSGRKFLSSKKVLFQNETITSPCCKAFRTKSILTGKC